METEELLAVASTDGATEPRDAQLKTDQSTFIKADQTKTSEMIDSNELG